MNARAVALERRQQGEIGWAGSSGAGIGGGDGIGAAAALEQEAVDTRRCRERLENRNLMHIQWPRFIGSPPIHPLSKLGM